MKKVSLVIPAHNEESCIEKTIRVFHNELKKENIQHEILVINDNSKDKTEQILQTLSKEILELKYINNIPPNGFGFAVRKGLENFQGDYVAIVMADLSDRPVDLVSYYKKIEEGYDLVLGSRFGKKIKHMPFMKRIGNKAFSKVISSLTGIDITDSTTGYRAFTKEVAEEIEFINTFTYTQEQIIKAAKEKFRITEIFVRTRKTRESRLFKNPFEYALKAWINILRIYRDYDPLKFFGITGGILSSLGLIIGLWFVYLHFTTGITGHLGLLILMILLLLTGIQIILFGFLADMRK